MTPNILDFSRTIGALAFAGACWIAETVTPDIPGVPPWLTSLGLPIAFLVAVIYALVGVFKLLRESQNGRLADRDTYAAKLEANEAKASVSWELLIKATTEQTGEFKKLGEDIRRLIDKK